MGILDGLNAAQVEAVKATEGCVRLIAGAGTGKTRVLTTRYCYLREELGVVPSRILAVTFTNKAANEMKTRIQKEVGADIIAPYVMTFHGFCNSVLKEEIEKLGYPLKFKIIDSEDQISLLKPIYAELGLTNKDYPYKKALSDLIGKGCKTGPRLYLPDYERVLTTYSSKEIDAFIEVMPGVESKIILGYLREQKKDYCLDYDDLLNFVLYLFKTNRGVKEYWQERFDYVEVDEFQDVSLREFELVSILTEKTGNLFVVGDNDQSVYSWRGADVNCIVRFQETLEKLRKRPIEVQTMYLKTNYRSTPDILNVSNDLIKKNINRLEKELNTPNKVGARVLHYHARSVYQEAEWVARKVKSLGLSYSDIAILYRNNAMSRAIEEKLMTQSIPYEVLSGISFYQRKEVKDVLAVLSLVVFEDNTSFKRVITNNPLKIGKKKLEVLDNISKTQEISLFKALKQEADTKTFKATKGAFLVQLIEKMQKEREYKTLGDMVMDVAQAFEYEELYAKTGEIERYENILELKNAAKYFEVTQQEKVDLAEFLGVLALYTDADKGESKDKVKLMTIHAAKGLEYPVVFIIGMNEGLMPSSRARTLADLEEERRIAYVAMTRAQKQLFLTDAEGENYDKTPRLPSRFIYNVARELYEVEGNISKELEDQARYHIANSERKAGHEVQDMLDVVIEERTQEIIEGAQVYHNKFGEGIVLKEQEDMYIVLFAAHPQAKGISKDSKKLQRI